MNGNISPSSSQYASDLELSLSIRAGNEEAFRWLMTRNNQLLFRIARGFLSTDHEAEDAVQQAYVNAFERIHTFRGDATISTWLTRIVINVAKQRLRYRRMVVEVHGSEAPESTGRVVPFPLIDNADPAAYAAQSELRHSLEIAIDALPMIFRTVFILRDIEECSVEETATILDLLPATVKTRLHRARRMVRANLEERAAASLHEAFHFRGVRCARTTQRVIDILRSRDVILS